MPIKTILWATVFPSVLVGVSLIMLSILGRRVAARVERSTAPTTTWSILTSLWLAGSFALGSYQALGKWPPFPPLAGEEWLVYIALVAGPLGAALAVLSSRSALFASALVAALLAGAVVVLSLGNAGEMGRGITRVLWATGIIAYVVVLSTLIEVSARRRDDTGKPTVGAASLPLALGAVGVLSFVTIALLENVKEGMMMGALGGLLVAIGVLQLIWPWRFYIRGLAPAFGSLYAGLWLTTTFYSSTPNWTSAALGLIAPFPPAILSLNRRASGPAGALARRPFLSAFLQAMIGAAFVGTALAILIANGALKPEDATNDAF